MIKKFVQIFLFLTLVGAPISANQYNTLSGHYDILSNEFSWMNKKRYSLVVKNSRSAVVANLACSIIQYESNGESRAISKVNARGIMQVMPVHYKNKKLSDLFIDEINIKIGCACLREYLSLNGWDIENAVRSYNAGPGRKHRADKKYVAKVLKKFKKLNRLCDEYNAW